LKIDPDDDGCGHQIAGFFEARRACCGTGTIETSVLCHQGAPGTCANATGYVFWDGFHPTDAANKVLADALLLQGLQLIS
jgi:phospholipase/lecithinase/hemolysin